MKMGKAKEMKVRRVEEGESRVLVKVDDRRKA